MYIHTYIYIHIENDYNYLNPKGRAAFVLTAQPQRVTMWCPCLKRQHKHHGSLPQEANEEATAWKTKTPKEKGTTGPQNLWDGWPRGAEINSTLGQILVHCLVA